MYVDIAFVGLGILSLPAAANMNAVLLIGLTVLKPYQRPTS